MKIKEHIESKIKKILEINGVNTDIEVESTKDNQHGDFTTNIALKLAGQLKKSPKAVAENILQEWGADDLIDKIEIAGPGFINFFVSQKEFKGIVNQILEDQSFGEQKILSEKWLIEHTSPNPNKSMHLGHLRNNVTGMAISNLAKSIGIEVVMDCIDNNRGIAIAKLMWGYLKFANKDKDKRIEDLVYWSKNKSEWSTPELEGVTPDKFMDALYVKASEDFKNPDIESKVRNLVVLWEQEDPIVWDLWKLSLSYVYKGQEKTLKRLNSHWDFVWHEHEHYKEGKEIVEQGIKKGIFIQLEDGAVVTNLSEYKIPDTIVIKKDGTSLYITQDLALTKRKLEKFNPNKLFWVIGPEQALAMKQVFAVASQLGFGEVEKFKHISYGFISIKGEGKMSSRAGNVIYIDDLLDDAKEVIVKKIKNETLSEEQKEIVAEKIGIGAVKYSILKVGRQTDIAFDFDASLSFEGDSGPYLMYTYARCNSILNQYGSINKVNDFSSLYKTEEEQELLKKLALFPETIKEAALSYAPNLLCAYLFELAQLFNKFYNTYSILKGEDVQIIHSRVLLVNAVATVLNNGLSILGIESVESM